MDAADLSDSESGADDDNIMEDNPWPPETTKVVEDLEVFGINENDSGSFDMTTGQLRTIAESGWVAYDEEHSEKLKLDADYFDGQWDPTQSAVAYADSPLGMFFYFLLNQLRVRIAEETNRYRD